MLILWIILLIIGFVFLIKGADFFVDGAVSIAKGFGVSALVIGLTIVAFGTSLPELVVSMSASLQGANDISFGNILGSNMFNTLVILGATALIAPLVVRKTTAYKEVPFLVLATTIVGILAFDEFFQMSGLPDQINRADGVILILLFVVFLYYLFSLAKGPKEEAEIEEEVDEEVKELSVPMRAVYVVGGLAAVIGGGVAVVESASRLAAAAGMSEALIGLTVVAFGTSLPEFVTSIIAARKGQTDLAVGNVVGSNIFNLLLILGLTSLVSPINLNGQMIWDYIFLTLISIFFMVLVSVRRKVTKFEGLVMVFLYVLYIGVVIWRNYYLG